MTAGVHKAFAVTFFFVAAVACLGAEKGRRDLSGHVPPAVKHLAAKGRVAGTNQIELAIGLPLRNEGALDEFIRQLYDPSSPNFHRFITPPEFATQFGATEQDYEAVENFARTNGLTVTATHGNRLLLDVAGPVASIEKAFKVTLHTYSHPTEARDFFAPDTEPSIDSNIPILHVSGLDNFLVPRPASMKIKLSGRPAFNRHPVQA